MAASVIVSIGRNVGDVPMPDGRWLAFKAQTMAAVTAAGFTPVFRGEGLGQWTDEDGETVYESAYTIVALPDGEEADRRQLIDAAGELAHRFGQDAVAVTSGETVLAGLE